MLTLFPLQTFPAGFSFFPDFISRAEEDELLQQIEKLTLHPFVFQGFEAKRRVASFGYDYSFDEGALKKGQPIPEGFQPLIKKVADKLLLAAEDFAELLVIEYPPGAVINWRRDAPPFDLIAGISLASGCVFRFRPYEREKQGKTSVVSLQLQPRSLYVIDGAARSGWQHSTAPVKSPHYSITLRTLRRGAGAVNGFSTG